MNRPRHVAEVLRGFVVVRGVKQVLVLAPEELEELVKRDAEVWTRALRRGKFLVRAERTAQREVSSA